MLTTAPVLALLASAVGFASSAPTASSLASTEQRLLEDQLGLFGRTDHDDGHVHIHSAPVQVNVPIHESCNGTQRAQIQKGLDDMRLLVRTSLDHIHATGPSDSFFVKYFGQGADPAPVIGYLEEVLHGDKTGTLLRCDNPDGNCNLPEWGGHWRGDNATQETVICEYSYHTRRPLEQICGLGFQIARDNAALYWGADLLHRLFHVPKVSNEKISHVADGYADVLELARTNATASVSNQHTIQYYVLDVFSRTIVEEGCVGEPKDEDDHEHKADAPASASTGTASTVSAAPAASTATVASQSSSSSDCHTHADGSVHCGSH